MNARKTVVIGSLLMVIALMASACAPAATPTPAQAPQRPQMADAMSAATTAPQPTAAAPGEATSANKAGLGGINASPHRESRLIIKNGEMNLRVADTDRAIDQVTAVAVETGGYIISARTWVQDDFKYASLTMGVPADQFEAAQRRLRALAVQVLSDTASGQDVSDEYVDLQSRLTNLEATAARIREFLNQATKVDEALAVNAKLTEVEAEIEQVKGRMAYLKDRSAFSTVAINLEPQRPTPTPTPTPTPAAWMPEKTFNQAAGTLSETLRAIGDLAIWFGVVVVPLAGPVAIVYAIIVRARRKSTRREMAVEKREA